MSYKRALEINRKFLKHMRQPQNQWSKSSAPRVSALKERVQGEPDVVHIYEEITLNFRYNMGMSMCFLKENLVVS